jgi:hypothetical protein
MDSGTPGNGRSPGRCGVRFWRGGGQGLGLGDEVMERLLGGDRVGSQGREQAGQVRAGDVTDLAAQVRNVRGREDVHTRDGAGLPEKLAGR